MSKLEIKITFEPTHVSNWTVSYGKPVGCFKTWDRRSAIRSAKKVASNNRPSTLIVFDKKGNLRRQIEYRSEFTNNPFDLTNGYSPAQIERISESFNSFVTVLLVACLCMFGLPIYLVGSAGKGLIAMFRNLWLRVRISPPMFSTITKAERPTRVRLIKAPGTHLLNIVDFLYSPRTVELCFKQIVADWRDEHFEALKQRRNCKALWISMRYRCRFLTAMGLSKIFAVLTQIISAKK